MLRNLFIQIAAAISGLWLATILVSGVEFDGKITTFTLAGLILGLLNYFVKPILKTITFPLRIITLNLFTIVISMGLVWIVDIILPELTIVQGLSVQGLIPLFWTTLIIWLIALILSSIIKKSENKTGNPVKQG
jgi:putative membrane protein